MVEITAAEHLSLNNNSYCWTYKNGWVDEVAGIASIHGREIQNATVLELGAGVHNPLGGALAALSKGAKRAVAVEPSDFEPDHWKHAIMLGLVASYKLQNCGPKFNSALDGLIHHPKIMADGPAHLKRPEIELFNGTVQGYKAEEQFDIVYSNAVIEHVLDLAGACTHLFDITAAEGIHIHKVDFIDHRYYKLANPEPQDAYRFLLKGEEGATPDCNGLRMGDVIREFVSAGFTFLESPQKWECKFNESDRARLQERYSDLQYSDIATTCAVLVFRKSGGH